jgi:hypothetical protein
MRLTMEELYRRLVLAESRVTSLERQLSIDLGTGLIAIRTSLPVAFSQHGGIAVDESGWYRVPFDCILKNIWVRLTTASSSGSVTARVTDGTTNWDNTLAASATSGSSTPNASLDAGDEIRAAVTAAGTGAEDLVVIVALAPR